MYYFTVHKQFTAHTVSNSTENVLNIIKIINQVTSYVYDNNLLYIIYRHAEFNYSFTAAKK